MLKFLSKSIELSSPVTGELISLEKVLDPVFSKKMMGEGFAINPSSNQIYSPIQGIVTGVFPTQHAITIQGKKGVELLVHMGIDTVELNGEGFNLSVQEGSKVNTTTLLAKIDFDVLKNKEKPNTIIVVFPDFKGKMNIIDSSSVNHSEIIGSIHL